MPSGLAPRVEGPRPSARWGLLGLIVLGIAGRSPNAAAQAPDRSGAEAIERRARATGDAAAFVECGQAYLARFNQDPDGRGSDALLYNAAVCFQEGGSIGVAISSYLRLLERRDADRDLRARAMVRLVAAYEQIASYDQAAQVLERYADEYGSTSKDAALALGRAVELRRGLGQHDRAIADTLKFVRLPGVSARDKATAFFRMGAIHAERGDTKALIAHLRRYLAEHGAGGAPELRVAAHTKLGQALWTQSCPVAPIDGSCLRVVRDRARSGGDAGRPRGRGAPASCGRVSPVRLEVVTRDARTARQAMEQFAAAISVSGRIPSGDGQVAHYHGVAVFHQAEPAYEEYLRITFPSGLDLDPKNPAASRPARATLDRYLASKATAGAAARRAYEDVARTGDATMTIASITRHGQMHQHAADELSSAAIPARVRGDAKAAEVFCTALRELAEPLEASAASAYEVCLDRSRALGWFSTWSSLCERQLGQLAPDRFPPAREQRAVVGAPSVLTDVEPVRPPASAGTAASAP